MHRFDGMTANHGSYLILLLIKYKVVIYGSYINSSIVGIELAHLYYIMAAYNLKYGKICGSCDSQFIKIFIICSA